MALVVVRQGAEASAEDILQFLSSKVVSWQVPDHVEFVDDLPKTGVGKIDKRQLRHDVVPKLLEQVESEQS